MFPSSLYCLLPIVSFAPLACHALVVQEPSSSWQPLFHHVDRREVLSSAAHFPVLAIAAATDNPKRHNTRSVASIDSSPAIPVWPTWGGGRVVPVSLGSGLQDPFLLLAHHKHWFDPRDPLRGPFKVSDSVRT